MILHVTILTATSHADVPKLVKKLRRIKGMTQEQLAREVGITFATVNSWENGRRFPQPFLLKRLMELEKEWTRSSKGGLTGGHAQEGLIR